MAKKQQEDKKVIKHDKWFSHITNHITTRGELRYLKDCKFFVFSSVSGFIGDIACPLILQNDIDHIFWYKCEGLKRMLFCQIWQF